MTSSSLRRLAALLRKEARETLRDWKMLGLTLTFAPFFVLLMYAYLGQASQTYDVAVVNEDRGVDQPDAGATAEAAALMRAMSLVASPEGETVLRVRDEDMATARALLRDRRVDLIVIIPEDFSEALVRHRDGRGGSPTTVRTIGDPGNASYLMAAVWVDMVTLAYAGSSAGLESPVALASETVTDTTSLNEFELYVPALLILALIMLMFTAAGALIREKDKGTLVRLRMSNMKAGEWLTAVSLTQILVGTVALALTYATAMAVGYPRPASPTALLVVTALCSLSVMAFSVLVAAYLRTIFDLVTVGCFPFFVLMFFSGGMLPLPGVSLFQVGDRVVELNEVLPTTHGIAAMSKILNFGSGLDALAYEVAAMLLLTVFFFALGTWIFRRRHMPRVG